MHRTALLALAALTLSLGAAVSPYAIAAEAPAAAAPAKQAPAATSEIGWYRSFDEALAAAKEKELPIIVDFYTDWCGWCKRMDASTFKDPEVVKLMNSYIPAKIDAEKDKQTAARYGVRSFPSFVLVNHDGTAITTLKGYREAAVFQKEVKDALTGPNSAAALQKAYADGTASFEQLEALAVQHLNNNQIPQGLAVLQKIADKDLDNKEKRAERALVQMAHINYQLKQFDKALPLFQRVDTRYPDSEMHSTALIGLAKCYQHKGEFPTAITHFERFLKTYPEHAMAEKISKEIEMLRGKLAGK